MIKSEFPHHKITVAQALALQRVYARTPLYSRPGPAGTMGIPKSSPFYELQEPLTFEEFLQLIQVSTDCVMVPWCGMWLGIEEDGYTHS